MVVCVRFCPALTPIQSKKPIGKTDIYNVLPTGVFTELNLKLKTK